MSEFGLGVFPSIKCDPYFHNQFLKSCRYHTSYTVSLGIESLGDSVLMCRFAFTGLIVPMLAMCEFQYFSWDQHGC